MALFRVLARLLHSSPRLSECSRTGATSFFLVHLEKRALRDVSKLPRSAARLSTEAKEKRPKVTRNNQEHGSVLNELMSVKEPQPTQLTVGAKGNENLPPLVKLSFSLAYAVVQAGKDFTYLLVVLGGFAVAGFLLWSVGSEFFSSNSPQTVYSKALKRVRLDPQVVDALGGPISGHGELSGRGRRREPLHQEYVVEGVTYMRMKFYVKGSLRSGTVQLDMKTNVQGKYELRFLFVELDGRPKRTIVIEDNR
jgi:hypothetical protein